jgi:hypothetical protein
MPPPLPLTALPSTLNNAALAPSDSSPDLSPSLQLARGPIGAAPNCSALRSVDGNPAMIGHGGRSQVRCGDEGRVNLLPHPDDWPLHHWSLDVSCSVAPSDSRPNSREPPVSPGCSDWGVGGHLQIGIARCSRCLARSGVHAVIVLQLGAEAAGHQVLLRGVAGTASSVLCKGWWPRCFGLRPGVA